MMGVGGYLIRPINESIAAAIKNNTLDAVTLTRQLKDWMFYNDLRMVIMTIMWCLLFYYFYNRNNSGEQVKR